MPNTYTSLAYHLIFSTEGRAPFIASAIGPQVHAYLAGIIDPLDAHPGFDVGATILGFPPQLPGGFRPRP